MTVIKLVGHLTLANVRGVLSLASKEIVHAAKPVIVIVDCLQMTGYDADARDAFVQWNSQNRDKVTAVGIVTTKMVWHMAVRAMALAARQELVPFSSHAEAQAWASEVVRKAKPLRA